MIDIADYAVGLSRQLYGRVIASERAEHRMVESWHPLGVVGIISAFNFPAAVWSWNTAVALVCGDTVVWKPSEQASLIALACDRLLARAAEESGAPAYIHHLLIGGRETGETLVEDPRVALVSATGSVPMGRAVGPRVAARFGRSLLELGGNNAAIIAPSADLELALPAVLFAAAGDRGAALHLAAAAHRAPGRRGRAAAAADRRLRAASRRRPVRQGHARRPADLPGSARDDAGGDRPGHGRRRKAAGRRRPGRDDRRVRRVRTARGRTYRRALPRGAGGDVRAAAVCADVRHARRSHRPAERRSTGPVRQHLHAGPAGGRDLHVRRRRGHRLGEREPGHVGGGGRRRLRWREGDRGGRACGSDAWHAYMRRSTSVVNYSGEVALAQNISFS